MSERHNVEMSGKCRGTPISPGICKDVKGKGLQEGVFINDVSPKELRLRDFCHGDETERLAGDSGCGSRLMLLDEYRTRKVKL
jgi:hypothetical protein